MHVGGFPAAARTDAIMTPIKAVSGCEDTWFHWIDDTSGVAECQTAEGVAALLEAAAAAKAAVGVSESAPRVVDPLRILLQDLTLTQMDHAILAGGGAPTPTEAEEESESGKDGEKRGTKRPRQEDTKEV